MEYRLTPDDARGALECVDCGQPIVSPCFGLRRKRTEFTQRLGSVCVKCGWHEEHYQMLLYGHARHTTLVWDHAKRQLSTLSQFMMLEVIVTKAIPYTSPYRSRPVQVIRTHIYFKMPRPDDGYEVWSGQVNSLSVVEVRQAAKLSASRVKKLFPNVDQPGPFPVMEYLGLTEG